MTLRHALMDNKPKEIHPMHDTLRGAIQQYPYEWSPGAAHTALGCTVNCDPETLEINGVTDWLSFYRYAFRSLQFEIEYLGIGRLNAQPVWWEPESTAPEQE